MCLCRTMPSGMTGKQRTGIWCSGRDHLSPALHALRSLQLQIEVLCDSALQYERAELSEPAESCFWVLSNVLRQDAALMVLIWGLKRHPNLQRGTCSGSKRVAWI